MAKFCSNCGKELVDGKCSKCGTTNTNNSFGAIMKKYWELLKESIKKPFDVVKKNNSEDNFILSLISIGITSILGGLFMCAIIKSILGGFGDFVDIPYVKVFFVGFLVFAVLLAATALIGYVIFDKCVKAKTSIKKMFVCVGLSQMLLTFAIAIITVIAFVALNETTLYIIEVVLLFATTLWMANMVKGLDNYIEKVDDNKFVYAYAALYSIVIIVLYLCVTNVVPEILK